MFAEFTNEEFNLTSFIGENNTLIHRLILRLWFTIILMTNEVCLKIVLQRKTLFFDEMLGFTQSFHDFFFILTS